MSRQVNHASLKCPWCGGMSSKVKAGSDDPQRYKLDRGTYSGEGYWRKHQCLSCHRFFTSEQHVTGGYPTPITRKRKNLR